MISEYMLQRKYGISLDEYEELLRKQRSACAICRKHLTKPHIDHDHTTGRVRGILCMQCNTGLGMFRDNTRLLTEAIFYLQQSET